MTTTTPNQLCPDCGSPVPAAAPEGLCPRCLARAAVDSADQPAPGTDTLAEQFAARRFFGDYELLGEVARGGMGIVFKARQLGVNRVVALKVLAGGAAAGREFVHRFHNEAASAARLEHPHIVPIYEFGEHEGTHFLAMRFLEGGTLQSRVAREMPAPAEAARTIITLANAVEHAHRRGVLHRDLKPGNVLLDGAGAPHVADFGLARVMEAEDTLTLSRAVIGTAAYLAPEVAGGGAACATVASDIYGLGAILYELLTGRPPFGGTTIGQTLRAVQDVEPVRPGQIRSAVAPDLETICLKCLEKDPARRYATAQALADDLDRFLNGEPVHARPVTDVERAWRWCRRKPALASAIVLILVLVLVLEIASTVAAFRINQERRKAEAQAYTSDMNLVQQAWDGGNLKRAQALLRAHIPNPGEPDLRGFEWRYLWGQCQDESRLSFTNFPVGVRAALSPDGSFMAAISGPTLKLLDYTTGRELKALSVPMTNQEFWALVFSSRDTNVLATTSERTLMLWNLARGEITASMTLSNLGAALAFSRDGKQVAVVGGNELSIELWNLETRSQAWQRKGSNWITGDIGAIAFTRDDQSLVSSGGVGGNLLLWNISSGASSPFPLEHKGWVQSCDLSADGRTLVTGANDSRMVFWDLPARKARSPVLHLGGNIAALKLSPDGQFVLTGGGDSTVRLWEIATGQQKRVYRGHQAGVTDVFFSPDRGSVISSSWDRTIKVWDREPESVTQILHTNRNWSSTITFSSDGKKLATTDLQQGVLSVWDVAARSHIADLTKASDEYAGTIARFSPDGQWLALAGHDHRIRLWDGATLAPREIMTNSFDPSSLSFSPDSRILALAGIAGFDLAGITNRLAFWDLVSKRPINLLQAAVPMAGCASFAHRQLLLAVGYLDGTVRIWNFRTEQLVAEFADLRKRIWAIAFSPDDTWVAAGGLDGAVVFYDVRERRAFRPPADTSWWVLGVDFAPDGRTLASAESDGTIRLWNVTTRRSALELRGHAGMVSKVGFSPDGKLLASCGADGTLRLWSAPSFAEIDARSRTPLR